MNPVKILNFLLSHPHLSVEYINFTEKNISTNLIFKSNTNGLKTYLKSLILAVDDDLRAEPQNRKLPPEFILLCMKFLHTNKKQLDELNLTVPEALKRKELKFTKIGTDSTEHSIKDRRNFTYIDYDPQTKLYTSPDDHMAHQHGSEANRIFFSTQTERLKGFISRVLAKIGIHVFESAPYEEHDYLHSDIYTNDLAINPYDNEHATHFFNGHATNLITIPAPHSPLYILTDPVEGDLNPVFYPRMTEVANKINHQAERMLPKVDMVIISHNHRDHVDINTLKQLVAQQPLMVIPEGDEALFKSLGFIKIVELKWWEQVAVKQGDKEILRITGTPTRHWSGRGLCDAHHSAFNGYVLQAPTLKGDIYFAGDTALMKDETSSPIFEHFNVQVSIQPGGPDEVREDMETTHQCSADALLMHFKILKAQYNKEGAQPDLQGFLEKTKTIKTIYNHTATFKLGSLRLRDTFYSVNRVIAAFKEDEQWANNNLTTYELNVFTSIQKLVSEMHFSNDDKFSSKQIIEILTNSVIIPKIGERLELNSEFKQEINYRNLILNKRALTELDSLAQKQLSTDNFDIRTFLIAALESYHKLLGLENRLGCA